MKNYRAGLFLLADVAGFAGGFCLFILAAFGTAGFQQAVRGHALPLSALALVWLAVFFIFNFYDLERAKPNLVFLRNYGIAAVIMLGIGFIFFYIDPVTQITPKTNLFMFEGISLALILGLRRAIYQFFAVSLRTQFAIICSDERHQALTTEVNANPHLGFQCVGVYPNFEAFEAANPDIELLVVHKTAVEETERLEKVLASSIDVIDLAEAYEMILYKIPVHFINSHWIIHSIRKQGNLLYEITSRIISIVFAIIVLIATSPISLIVIIAIKLEDGKQLFIRQARTGLHGKPFMLYKFRSMIVMGADGQAESGTAVWSTGGRDPRITRVGAITRKLHLDEIPQMLNLLKGDLTLVGPRPERPEFVASLEKDIPYYFMRHTIKPGFTGWAQIKFRYARSVMDSEQKFEYDLYYIKNRNLFLDFGIILKTAQIVFTHLD